MAKKKLKSSTKLGISVVCIGAKGFEHEALSAFLKKHPDSVHFESLQELAVDADESAIALALQPLKSEVLIFDKKFLPDLGKVRSMHRARNRRGASIVGLSSNCHGFLMSREKACEKLHELALSTNQVAEWEAVRRSCEYACERFYPSDARLEKTSLREHLNALGRRLKASLWSPIKAIRNHGLSTVAKTDTFARFVFSWVSLLMLVSMIILSRGAGISADEHRYIRQAEKVISYYQTFGEDKRALKNQGIDPVQYNNQTFDNFLTLLVKIFNPSDSHRFRHFFNSIVGWIGIFFMGLIVGRFFGWHAATLTIVLIFLSPRYLGHCFNNNRDIPVATSYIMGLYFTIRYLIQFRHPKRSTLAGLGLSIASGFASRFAAGTLSVGILGILVLFQIGYQLRLKWNKMNIGNMLSTHIRYLVPTCLIAYALSILVWPYGLEAPIKNSIEVFQQSSNISVTLRNTFAGEFIMSNEIPRYYTPLYILISSPILIFIAFAVFLFAWLSGKIHRQKIAFIIFCAFAIPLLYAVLAVKTDYGGWRHFLLIYPFLAALAALGIKYLTQLLPANRKLIAVPLVLVGMYHPIRYNLANHPYQYTYYNEGIGGVNGAVGNFETDYSLHSLREGVEWVIENAETTPGKKVIVASNDGAQLTALLKKDTAHFQRKYKRYYEKYNDDWDYGVFVSMYIHPEQIKAGYWPPPNLVHEIKVDDVTICAVVKRDRKEDLAGFQAAKQGNHQEAIRQFEMHLAHTPEKSQVWSGLASSYYTLRNYDKALEAAEQGLIYHPASIACLNTKGLILFNRKDYAEAEQIFEKLYSQQKGHYAFCYYLALCQANLGKLAAAKTNIDRALALNQKFAPAYDVAAQIYTGLGLTAQAERLKQLKGQLGN